MVCIHHVLAKGYLLATGISFLPGGHLVAGLELALGGVVLGARPGWFLCGMGNQGRHLHILSGDILLSVGKGVIYHVHQVV